MCHCEHLNYGIPLPIDDRQGKQAQPHTPDVRLTLDQVLCRWLADVADRLQKVLAIASWRPNADN